MKEKKRVYITVKTYPTISEKYSELVCTAGLLEDGSWIRLYPVPFRLLRDDQKYPKYTWVEVEVEKNTTDIRCESYRPDWSTIIVNPKPKVNKIEWDNRRKIILQTGTVYTNMQIIIDLAHSDEKKSLATFKPTRILDFIVKKDTPNWDAGKLSSLLIKSNQLSLFQTEEEIKEEFRLVEKIPYKFYYKFEDDEGKVSQLMIEDWELGMLFLNCRKGAGGNEKIAIEKVRETYFDKFLKRDTYFFLGTTQKNHRMPYPYIIIGVFSSPMPPEEEQLSLF